MTKKQKALDLIEGMLFHFVEGCFLDVMNYFWPPMLIGRELDVAGECWRYLQQSKEQLNHVNAI